MKKIIFLLICGWSFSGFAISAKLNREKITQGESVELILSSENPIPDVDFKSLTKDFMLGGQSTSQSSRYVNGVGSTTYEKSIILFPTKEGSLTIPALKVGNEQTEPLTLEVSKYAPKVQDTNNNEAPQVEQPVLKATISQKAPYIGQSVFYTLTLSHIKDLADAEIIPSSIENVQLSILGQDKEINENGIKGIERTYLIKPEKSGTIEIPPALLNGQILYRPQRTPQRQGGGIFSLLQAADLMNVFSNGMRPIQIISNPITLEVKDKPQDWQGWWLPTSQAELTLDYDISEEVKEGNVFQATLTLKALNVDSNDLPTPKLPNDPNFRYYPEPEVRDSILTKNGDLESSVSIKYAIMPLTSGVLSLPETQIAWFNTQTETKEMECLQKQLLKIQSVNYNL